jgi:hypothetical protein
LLGFFVCEGFDDAVDGLGASAESDIVELGSVAVSPDVVEFSIPEESPVVLMSVADDCAARVRQELSAWDAVSARTSVQMPVNAAHRWVVLRIGRTGNRLRGCYFQDLPGRLGLSEFETLNQMQLLHRKRK